MKKHILIGLIALVILIIPFLYNFGIKENNGEEETSHTTLAVFIKNGGSYVPYTGGSQFPAGRTLNRTYTKCYNLSGTQISNSVVSYSGSTITLTSTNTISCELYFD